MSATISPCGKYRYLLQRFTDVRGPEKRVCWIMLNPSTADATTNDHTIDAVIDFSTRWNCTHIDVVNLYAFRSTDPAGLLIAADPVGPGNDGFIAGTCFKADLVVCAWGGKASWGRIEAVRRILPEKRYALHINADGSPKHPLYVKRTTLLLEYP